MSQSSLFRLILRRLGKIGVTALGLWTILWLWPTSAAFAASLCGTKTYLPSGSTVTLHIEGGHVVSEFTLTLTEDVTLTGNSIPPALTNAFSNVPGDETQTAALPLQRSLPMSPQDLSGKIEGTITFAQHGSVTVENKQKTYLFEHRAGEKIKAIPSGSGRDAVLDIRIRSGPDAIMAGNLDGDEGIILKRGTLLEIPLTHPRQIELLLNQGIYPYDSVDARNRARLEVESPLRTSPQSSFTVVLRKFGTVFLTDRVAACVRPANPALSREFIQMRDVEILDTKEGELHVKLSLPQEIQEREAFEWQKLATPIHLQVVGFAAGADSKILGETEYYIGSPRRAAMIALAAILTFYLLPLYFLKRRREKKIGTESGGVTRPGFKKPLWFSLLWLGRDRHGRASLSSCQIALWTYLVFGVAAYVFVLNGELIDISDSILILLGITGSASVAARFTASRQEEQVELTMRAGEISGSGSRYRLLTLAYPAWHDLISTAGRIDLARLQVFVFTVLAAFYVGITAIVTFQFPEVPDGLLWLMGISNGVYLGGKVAEPRLTDQLTEIDLQRRAASSSRETEKNRLKKISDRLKEKTEEEARLQAQIDKPPADVELTDLQAQLEDCRREISSLKQEQAAVQEAMEKSSTEESRLEATYRDVLKQLNKSIENTEMPGGTAAR